MFPKKLLCLSLLVLAFCQCSQLRVQRYQSMLDPLVGNAERKEVDKLLGHPASCQALELGNRCEYRTLAQRNHTVPDAHRPMPGFGPDLSPYEYFDVLSLDYDVFGKFKSWEPVVILQ